MSRSYKKKPFFKATCRGMKRYANKAVRHYKDLPAYKSKAYKKVFQSYDICDYFFYTPREEIIELWEREESELAVGAAPNRQWLHAKYSSLQECLDNWWTRVYKWK